MKADTKSPAEIFGYHIRYVVPLFQRPYVWNRAGSVGPTLGGRGGGRRSSARGPRTTIRVSHRGTALARRDRGGLAGGDHRAHRRLACGRWTAATHDPAAAHRGGSPRRRASRDAGRPAGAPGAGLQRTVDHSVSRRGLQGLAHGSGSGCLPRGDGGRRGCAAADLLGCAGALFSGCGGSGGQPWARFTQRHDATTFAPRSGSMTRFSVELPVGRAPGNRTTMWANRERLID